MTSGRTDLPSYKLKQTQCRKPNLKTIKRSNKISEASNLPIVLNLNPRSLYQKLDEFQTLIEQTDAGFCCISKRWDRSHVPGGRLLSDLIDIDGYQLVQNVVQRRKKGGKPAILANTNMFHIKELSPDVITVPVDIEAVWALLTTQNSFSCMKFKKIVVASLSTQPQQKDLSSLTISLKPSMCCAQNMGLFWLEISRD